MLSVPLYRACFEKGVSSHCALKGEVEGSVSRVLPLPCVLVSDLLNVSLQLSAQSESSIFVCGECAQSSTLGAHDDGRRGLVFFFFKFGTCCTLMWGGYKLRREAACQS